MLMAEDMLRAIENRVLRKILGSKWKGITGNWRKLHCVQLHDLYSSPNFISVNKSGRMRWAGHVAQMRERRVAHRVLVGKHEKDNLKDLSVDGRIILVWTVKKWYRTLR